MLYKGHTIIELMISLLLASFLSIVLVMSYVAIQKRFQLVFALSVMQDDAQFLINFLREKINSAGNFSCRKLDHSPAIQIFSKETIPDTLKSKLDSLSDVLILGTCEVNQGKRSFVQTAYYVSTASWKDKGRDVKAFFDKPLNSSRQELMSNVVNFKIRPNAHKNDIKGVGYELVFQLSRHVYRTWYGFGAKKQ